MPPLRRLRAEGRQLPLWPAARAD